MQRRHKLMIMIPIGIGAIAIFITAGGWLVKLLWNWLLPPLFGFPAVTFWQAFGLLALCRILFGGRGFGQGHSRHRTPEERDRVRQRIRARFGFGGPSAPAASVDAPAVESRP